jgi:O-antigen/teichoic acid export membrane protein
LKLLELSITNFDETNTPREIAIKSAKIVSKYGTTVQVIGRVIGAVLLLAGALFSIRSANPISFLLALIVAALIYGLILVQGAIFRMVANYVITRLEESSK